MQTQNLSDFQSNIFPIFRATFFIIHIKMHFRTSMVISAHDINAVVVLCNRLILYAERAPQVDYFRTRLLLIGHCPLQNKQTKYFKTDHFLHRIENDKIIINDAQIIRRASKPKNISKFLENFVMRDCKQ